MTNLDPQADKAVRDAVDAFMEGRLNPDFAGETVFETKNSRYRLLDGVVFAAPAETLIGSELVGWLMETTYRSVVGPTWQPGARAVLVDRHRGRNIIVTSTTRLLHLDDGGRATPAPAPVASEARLPNPGGTAWSSPPGPARIVPATPFPQPSVLPRAPIVPPDPYAVPPPPPYAAQPEPGQRRSSAVHLPPRPIAPAGPMPRPLPAPLPPPRREPFTGLTPPTAHLVEPPPAPATEETTDWNLTSAEFELEGEDGEADAMDNPSHYDATQQVTHDSVEIPADEIMGGPDSAADAPILLVRPISPSSPGAPPRTLVDEGRPHPYGPLPPLKPPSGPGSAGR